MLVLIVGSALVAAGVLLNQITSASNDYSILLMSVISLVLVGGACIVTSLSKVKEIQYRILAALILVIGLATLLNAIFRLMP